MVTRACKAVLAAWTAVLLAGCPDDLGQGLGGEGGGLLAPESLSATANGGSEILLTWEDRATNESGYRLEFSSEPFYTSTVPSFVILPANSTSHVFASTPTTPYYFRVFAVTDSWESAASNEIALVTPNVPARPQILSVWGVSSTLFYMTWSLVSGETGYQIETSKDGGQSWTPTPVLVPAGIDSAVVDDLEPGTPYQVRVVALGPYGRSTPSWTVLVTTPPHPSPY
jgi:hypothetical protein